MKLLWTLAAALALATALPVATASYFDPHRPSFSPSWAEGWYLPVVTDPNHSDKDAPASFGVIFGAAPRAPLSWNASAVMLLTQEHTGKGRLRNDTATNLGFTLRAGGAPVTQDPSPDALPDFLVTAASSGDDDESQGALRAAFQGDDCSVAVAVGGAGATITCAGPPEFYGPDDESPEAWAASLPLPLHWYALSMATPVVYSLQRRGGITAGRGWMHAEKNWGEAFPEAWVWAQGASRDGGSSFVLAGGVAPVPGLPPGLGPEIWLAGVHVGALAWKIHPWDPTKFSVELDDTSESTMTTLRLTATAPWAGRELRMVVRAPNDSFSELLCPTRAGFKPDSDHSYAATATLELWTLQARCGWGRWLRGSRRVLIHSEVIEGAALELGGTRRRGAGRDGAAAAE